MCSLTVLGYVTTMFSEQFAAAAAAVLCVISIAIVLVFVPKSTKDPTRLEDNKDNYSEWYV